MGQQEVYDFLCKNRKKWFTSREISAMLGVSIGSVTMSLKKLRKTNIIKYKKPFDDKRYIKNLNNLPKEPFE